MKQGNFNRLELPSLLSARIPNTVRVRQFARYSRGGFVQALRIGGLGGGSGVREGLTMVGWADSGGPYIVSNLTVNCRFKKAGNARQGPLSQTNVDAYTQQTD